MDTFSFFIHDLLSLQCGHAFRSDFSPVSWELIHQMAEQLATLLFDDYFFQEQHKHPLDKLQWDGNLSNHKQHSHLPPGIMPFWSPLTQQIHKKHPAPPLCQQQHLWRSHNNILVYDKPLFPVLRQFTSSSVSSICPSNRISSHLTNWRKWSSAPPCLS